MYQSSEPGFRTLRTMRAASINLRQRRAWFADAPEGEPAPDTAPGTNSGGSTGTTFTQADVDRIVGERAKRAKEAGISELLKELGFEKPDDLKTLVTTYRAADEAEKSELEKAQVKITALEKKAQEAEQRAAQSAQERLEERRNAAILAALKDAEHPGDVLLWLAANKAEAVKATLKDDGTLDEKAISTLVTEAKKERPSYFKSGSPGSPSNAGGKTPSSDQRKDDIRKTIRVRY